MKIIKNFVRPVTVEQINGELSGIGAQLIDIVGRQQVRCR